MDALDTNILGCLDAHARQSTSDIARSVRHGRDIVEYRIEKLISSGVVTRTRAIIDPAAIGKTVFKTYFRLQQRCDEIDAFIAFLSSSDFVTCYAETMGGWDLIVNFIADSPHDFSDLLKIVTAKWHKLIREVRFSVITEYRAFSREGRGNSKRSRTVFKTCTSARASSIDDIDQKIISLLTQNARMPLSDICSAVGCHVATAKNRIQELEKLQVIVGYRASVDRKKLGTQMFKILIEETSPDPRLVKKLRDSVAEMPEVLSFIEQVGIYPIEMNVEAKDYDACDDVLNVLFTKFEDIMKQSSVLLVRNEAFNTLSFTKQGNSKKSLTHESLVEV